MFAGLQAVWGYWKVKEIYSNTDSWSNWTALIKISDKEWMWQIPLFKSTIVSIGIISARNITKDEYKELVIKYTHRSYGVESLEKKGDSYVSVIYRKNNYAYYSERASGKNWILVGDALCFGDPVYSVGTSLAMTGALSVSHALNNDRFDSDIYKQQVDNMLNTILLGYKIWYSGDIFQKHIGVKINASILSGERLEKFKKKLMDGVRLQVSLESSFIQYTKLQKNKDDKWNMNFSFLQKNYENFSIYEDGSFLLSNRKVSMKISDKFFLHMFKKFEGRRVHYTDLISYVEELFAEESLKKFTIFLEQSKMFFSEKKIFFDKKQLIYLKGELVFGKEGNFLRIPPGIIQSHIERFLGQYIDERKVIYSIEKKYQMKLSVILRGLVEKGMVYYSHEVIF